LLLRVGAVLVSALAVGGCGGDAPSPRGGSAFLPGPLPAGVEVAAEQTDAVRAPTFRLTLLDGSPVDPAEYWRDRPVVLVFFSSWCTLCARQQADLNRLLDRYGDGVVVLGVAGVDNEATVQVYLQEHDVPYAVGIDDPDGRIWNAFAVREPPVVAVVGRGGRLIRGWPGGVDADTLHGVLDGLVRLPAE
jgi:peroxiredoxin